MIEKLHQQGQKAVILKLPAYSGFHQSVPQTKIDVVNLNHFTESHLKETLDDIQDKFGLIGGFIHLHPVTKNVLSLSELFQERDEEIVKLVFLIAKYLKSSFEITAKNCGNSYFVNVTRLDGEMGTSGKKACSIVGGGLSGLVKSLHREWSNVCCRYIDLESNININEAADILIEEIADTNFELVEVGRTQEGERITLISERAYGVSYNSQETPDSQSVFLVTGGGRGITADCVVELAKAYKSKFILLGRTVLQPHEPEWVNNCTDEKELKKLIINHFIQQGKKPTPIEIDKFLHDLISQRDIRKSLEQIKQFGKEAIYLSVDVTQKLDLEKHIQKVQEYLGKITGIIHGAGNIADKRIEKKTDSDFNRVFKPKVQGLKNLLSIINPEQLKYIILFSSVSGYFGNAGQTDYALANEILNKFAYSFKYLFPKIHVVSINWGPWERGMINPTLKKFYQENNIDLIPVDIGIKFLKNEFRIAKEYVIEQILVTGKLSLPNNNRHIKQLNVLESQRIMREEDNSFLKHHVIRKHAVLPATCAVNWIVKSCEDVCQNLKVRVIENFKVLKGIVFDEQYQEEYLARVTPIDVKDDVYSFGVQISSKLKDKNHLLSHYSATAFFQKEWGSMPIYNNLDVQSDGKVYRTYEEGSALFHGQNFQGIKKVLHISDRKITSLCNLHSVSQKEQGQFPVNSFNPYLTDVQLQTVLLWTYFQLDSSCLPMGFEKVEQFQSLNFDRDFYVSTEISSISKNKLLANIFVHNEHGEIYIQWLQFCYILMKNL